MLKLRDYAVQLGGKEQNVVEKFAEAIESIPKTLIENAGHDPIVKLSELKKAHAEGKKEYGFNIYTGDVENMYEKDIIEPERVVRRAILSAAEFATTILKIDDIIAAAGKKFEPGKSKGEE